MTIVAAPLGSAPDIAPNPEGEAPPAPPAAAEPPPAISFPTTEAFNARVEQAARQMLKKEVGIGDLKTLKEQMAAADALRKAEEERRTAEMTELERERAARAAAEAEAAKFREAAAASAFEAHITRVCAERGIKDIEYAKYRVSTAAQALEEGAPPLDEAAFLDGLLADQRYRIALGVEDVPAVAAEPARAPAQTTPAAVVRPGVPGAPPKPAPQAAPTEVTDAMSLSPEAWAARKRALGIG